jgi:hypothetical protein
LFRTPVREPARRYRAQVNTTISPGEVLGFLLGTTVNIALLSYGARRLLGMRFPFLRTVFAGLVGQSAAGPVIAGLAGGNWPGPNAALAPFFLFVLLGTTVGLLIMIVLVVWEALVPTGSVPPMRSWIPGLRRRIRRGLRYAHVSQVLARHGLGSLLRGRGTSGGGAGASTVGDGDTETRRAWALAQALEECGTTFTKLGQVLATRRDLLPPTYVASLERLQDRTGTAPWEELGRVVEGELGASLPELFVWVDAEPLASASVAQVHAARLAGGVEVVVKIQRPGVKEQVARDLDILRRLAARLEDRADWARTMGVGGLAAGFDQALCEELDFRVEAENLAAVIAAGERPGIRIPKAFADLCTSRVLVMERLPGVPLARSGERIDELALDREQLARTLLNELLRQMLLDGVFHADPHPGDAGCNDTEDNIEIFRQAVEQLPGPRRRKILFRTDGAGFSCGLLKWIASAGGRVHPSFTWEYSTGWAFTQREMDAVLAVDALEERTGRTRWEAALQADGAVREKAFVIEVTGLLGDLSTWPPGHRVFVRREPLHPRYAKDASAYETKVNRAWLTATALACDLRNWLQLLGCQEPPKINSRS